MTIDLYHSLMIAGSTALSALVFGGYRSFKAKRRAKPYHVRNAGFWTDGRILRAEALFLSLILAGPAALFVMICMEGSGLLGGFFAMLGYTGLFFLLMYGLNRPSHEEQLIIDRAKAEARAGRQKDQRGG